MTEDKNIDRLSCRITDNVRIECDARKFIDTMEGTEKKLIPYNDLDYITIEPNIIESFNIVVGSMLDSEKPTDISEHGIYIELKNQNICHVIDEDLTGEGWKKRILTCDKL